MTQIYGIHFEQKNILLLFYKKITKNHLFNKGGSIFKFQFY